MKIFNPLLTAYVLFGLSVIFPSCTSPGSGERDFPTDSASLAKGKAAFEQNCSGCHNFVQDGIGPRLNGITRHVSSEWIMNFIRDPKKTIESGDERAKKLFDTYHTVMPSFTAISDDSLRNILAYLHSRNDEMIATAPDSAAITDPVPEKIAMSQLVVNVREVVRIPASSTEKPITRIAKLDYQPFTKKIFVLDLRGKLYRLDNGQAKLYMDMRTLRKSFIDKPGLATGFGSFAFHPEFLKNGLLYTTHTEPKGTAPADFGYHDSIPVALQWVLTEWKTDPDVFPFRGEGRELMRINMVTGIHGVQEITFNQQSAPGDKDYGYLYIGIGDGGCVENNFAFLSHNTAAPWGTIFRIDPRGNNGRNGRYGIPASNPFANEQDKLGEIYAYGFRNPHRITWTSGGQMLASNIGQANIESVNMIYPGRDYGWPVREGKFLLNPKGDLTKVYALPADEDGHFEYPVAAYDHDEGLAISGGFEYTGTLAPELKGKYLFGDINNGRLFYTETKDFTPGKHAPIREWQVSLNGTVATVKKLCGDERTDLRIGRDGAGEMYIFTKTDGKIYRLESVARQ